ncbi:MAG: hypothetical protein HeimC2_37440 [Candidatus Heimdallarchaeota archaeon LC_2]|nr:MAG: hypothetical protein HeimC2_37440 [Candidatus Heimdallarchaeota archaeon LC_2]
MRSVWVFKSIIVVLLITSQITIIAYSSFTNSVETEFASSNIEIGYSSTRALSPSQGGFTLPKVSESNVIIDGIVSPSEYVVSYVETKTNMLIYWEHDGEILTIGLVSPATGWLAFGIGSEMNNSNMIIGGYASGSNYCVDLVGIDRFHANDTDQAGTDDIIACESTEEATTTTLEFMFPFDSGDSLDSILTVDITYDMFIAFSASDNIIDNHGFRGRSDIMSVFIDSDEYIPELNIEKFDKSIPLVVDSMVTVDGIISAEEYPRSFIDTLTGIDVFWEHNSENFTIGLVAPGTGWVALGIGSNMQDSTMYMGGVENSNTYCVGLDGLENWLHEEDDTNDILECAASETDDETTLEFTIPMNTTDTLDTVLEVQKVYQMFLGYHESSDDRTQIHTAHSDVFTVLVMPKAQSIETFMTFQSETVVEFNETINFEIELSDENGSLTDVPVVFFMESQFGEVILATTSTDTNGKANANYSNPYLLNEHTFGARSLEMVVVKSGEVFAYQSSQQKQEIIFLERIENDDRAEYIRLSRIGLLVVFWIIGIIIWGGFGYVYYQLYQIFKMTNEDIEEIEKIETSAEDTGGI